MQCEIGALVVGGIFNAKENIRFCKGAEKGHFELSGSTIILLFEQGQMRLRPEIASQLLPKNRQNFHEIIVLLSVTFFWNCCVYSGARWIAKAWHHYDMTTSLDLLTPFAPWTVSIYLGCYVFWCINYYLCTLQEKTERDRFFCADALAKTLCFLFFLIIPTTNVRPEITEYQNIWDLLMKLVYRFDEADNLFPSIHCLVSWLCWIGVRKRKDIPIGYRYFSLITAVAVCISTLTTKQHVIADVIGGVLLAELCYILSDFPKVCRNYSVIYSHLFGKVKRNM